MKLPNPFIIEACYDRSPPVVDTSSAGTLEQGRPATVSPDEGVPDGGRVADDCSAISCGVNRNADPETGVTGGESAAPNYNADSSGLKARRPRSEHDDRGDDPMLRGVAALTSVSPGVVCDLYPRGEIDPSVMLDWAPGESSSCGSTESRRAGTEAVDVVLAAREAFAASILPTMERDARRADKQSPAGVAPGPHDPNTTEGGAQTPLAADALEHETAGGTDCIHEIFHFARLLIAQDRLTPNRIAPEIVAICEDIDDPLPLFLRTDHLRRWSA